MQNGCCPKCGQSEVNTRDIHPDPADPASTGLRLSVYVCLGCGYTESYTHPDDLAAIRADGRWRSVPRQAVTGRTIQLSVAAAPATPAPSPSPKLALSKHCPWCGSAKIIKRARVLDAGQHGVGKVNVAVERNPDSLFFSGSTYGTLRARICGRCGYAQFFSSNAQGLYQAFLEAEP
jgi:predicted nucleic-acid-binding Zn-ribbon protein